MTRQLLQQALDALDTCDAHLEVNGMNYGYYFNQEVVHNAVKALVDALARPEQEPIAYAVLTPAGAAKIWFGNKDSADRWHFNFGSGETLTPLYANPPVPDAIRCNSTELDVVLIPPNSTELDADRLYRNPADDVALQRAFDAMKKANADNKHREAILDQCAIAHMPYDETDPGKSLRDVIGYHGALADADRLDAQRYRYLRSGNLHFYTATSILNDSPEGIDAAIDAAMTGGQP